MRIQSCTSIILFLYFLFLIPLNIFAQEQQVSAPTKEDALNFMQKIAKECSGKMISYQENSHLDQLDTAFISLVGNILYLTIDKEDFHLDGGVTINRQTTSIKLDDVYFKSDEPSIIFTNQSNGINFSSVVLGEGSSIEKAVKAKKRNIEKGKLDYFSQDQYNCYIVDPNLDRVLENTLYKYFRDNNYEARYIKAFKYLIIAFGGGKNKVDENDKF